MKKVTILITLNIILAATAIGQVSRPGVPMTIHRSLELRAFNNAVILPALDSSALEIYADSIAKTLDCKDCKSGFYGKGIEMVIDVKASGVPEVQPGKGRLWLLPVTSATAYGMQFYFSKFHLPEGATLYLYNQDKTMILGAFTSENNNRDSSQAIQFGTQWIEGNTIYIEYYEPFDAEFEGELIINHIIHIYSDVFLRSSPFEFDVLDPCHINVSCPEGKGWEKEVNAVAIILKYNYSNKLTGICSGTMINNTAKDGRPLFLTAKHCVGFSQDPQSNNSTWLFLFNHQSKNCNSDGSDVGTSTTQSVYGSLVLSADVSPLKSDYALLELNTTPAVLASFGVCYAGWDRRDMTGPPPFVGIHHPRGHIKKISFEYDPVISFTYDYGIPNPEYYTWKVNDWDKGVTAKGSSGSGLFNSNHRLIGQLKGGNSECDGAFSDNGESDFYGKFSSSWVFGGLSFWLDPYSKGDLFIDTYCPVSCSDGIQNGSETGIDCGGNCPPCNTQGSGGSVCTTIQHTINGRSTIKSNIVNVCANSIVISPYAYTSCMNNALWNVTVIEQKVGNNKPCAFAGTPPGIPKECSTRFTPLPNCYCTYDRLFLGVRECDENKNSTGAEYAHWFDYNANLSGQSIFKQFKLKDYLPPGATIEEGKYYAIKTATSKNGWKEYTSFIRVYKDHLHIQNKNITQHQFANTIIIENSLMPAGKQLKIAAKSKIEILPNSTLENGTFYIDNFDCNSLDQFSQ